MALPSGRAYRRFMRWIFVTLSALSLACGGTTAPSDGGSDAAASDGPTGDEAISTGCGQFSGQSFAVDASACVPQLSATTSCEGTVCSYTVEVPCFDDAGAPDAAFAACQAWCTAAAPPNVPPTSFCQPFTTDAGTFASCGGCGI